MLPYKQAKLLQKQAAANKQQQAVPQYNSCTQSITILEVPHILGCRSLVQKSGSFQKAVALLLHMTPDNRVTQQHHTKNNKASSIGRSSSNGWSSPCPVQLRCRCWWHWWRTRLRSLNGAPPPPPFLIVSVAVKDAAGGQLLGLKGLPQEPVGQHKQGTSTSNNIKAAAGEQQGMQLAHKSMQELLTSESRVNASDHGKHCLGVQKRAAVFNDVEQLMWEALCNAPSHLLCLSSIQRGCQAKCCSTALHRWK